MLAGSAPTHHQKLPWCRATTAPSATSVQTPPAAADNDGYAASTTFSVASVAAPTGKRRRLLRGSNSSCATRTCSAKHLPGEPTAPPNHAEIMGSDSPTAKDVPAYTTEPDAPALRSDSIVAPPADPNNPTPPHDIYLAQSRPWRHLAASAIQGRVRADWRAAGRGERRHVEADRRPWTGTRN